MGTTARNRIIAKTYFLIYHLISFANIQFFSELDAFSPNFFVIIIIIRFCVSFFMFLLLTFSVCQSLKVESIICNNNEIRSNMELTGTIIAVFEAKSGTSSKTGNPWMMQGYVTKILGQYLRYCFLICVVNYLDLTPFSRRF